MNKLLKKEIEIFESLVGKLCANLDLPTKEWNKKVAPIIRGFLKWHKDFK